MENAIEVNAAGRAQIQWCTLFAVFRLLFLVASAVTIPGAGTRISLMFWLLYCNNNGFWFRLGTSVFWRWIVVAVGVADAAIGALLLLLFLQQLAQQLIQREATTGGGH